MAVSMLGGAGVKRALSESEDSEYSEDEGHYPTATATAVLASNVHPHKPEWSTRCVSMACMYPTGDSYYYSISVSGCRLWFYVHVLI